MPSWELERAHAHAHARGHALEVPIRSPTRAAQAHLQLQGVQLALAVLQVLRLDLALLRCTL